MGLWDRIKTGGTRAKETYSNGYYVGDFNAAGHRHGDGTYYYNSGNVYSGRWAYGKKSGYGVMKFRNGNRYEGNFEYGEYSGSGTFYYANGQRIVGQWRNDNPTYGTLYWSISEYCQGNFKDWKLDGRCLYTKNGSSYYVLYDNGTFIRRL